MLNQLLLGPRGKSISNEGESTEIGCQEYKITIWVGYLDKKYYSFLTMGPIVWGHPLNRVERYVDDVDKSPFA